MASMAATAWRKILLLKLCFLCASGSRSFSLSTTEPEATENSTLGASGSTGPNKSAEEIMVVKQKVCTKSAGRSSRVFAAGEADCCKDIERYIGKARSQAELWETGVAFGDASGMHCWVNSKPPKRLKLKGISLDTGILLYSSSKWVFAYTMLALVDKGLLTLNSRPADIFGWWTANPDDVRSQVELRHLLAQTDGMGRFGKVLIGVGCVHRTSLGCAKQAYRTTFKDTRKPGEHFIYTETSFYVMSAMALAVTGFKNIDQLFGEYMRKPLGMSETCTFSFPNKKKAFGGGGLVCNMRDYTKFLTALQSKTLVSKELHDLAEQPHTLHVKNWPPPSVGEFATNLIWVPSLHYHYGFGQWIECEDATCSKGAVRTNSIGAAGTFPWINRKNGTYGHWGVVARRKPMGYLTWSMQKIYEKIVPKVAANYGDYTEISMA